MYLQETRIVPRLVELEATLAPEEAPAAELEAAVAPEEAPAMDAQK